MMAGQEEGVEVVVGEGVVQVEVEVWSPALTVGQVEEGGVVGQ